MKRDEMQAALEEEFFRVGASRESIGPCSSVCVQVGLTPADRRIPEGWARYYDDHEEGFCPAQELLDSLRELPAGYCKEFADTEFWAAFPSRLLPTTED